MPRQVSRRNFNLGLAASLGLAGSFESLSAEAQSRAETLVGADPFSLGVASGDVTADSVVLWTRLAPSPLSEAGGMPSEKVPIEYVVSKSQDLSDPILKGVYQTSPVFGHSVHIELDGLTSGQEYWYQFRLGRYQSPTGRTRTLPASTSDTPIQIAQVSCQNFAQGYFSAYDHILADDPDIVLHLGDYIYEQSYGGVVRSQIHDGERLVSLDDFRRLYAQYKQDESLKSAHQHLPFICIPDNHDVQIDGDETGSTAYTNAWQAWYENMPVRNPFDVSGHPKIYRTLPLGGLATLYLLDTRQYRDTQTICSDSSRLDMGFNQYVLPCEDLEAESRSLLGAEQEGWLDEALQTDPRPWRVLASTIPMSPYRMDSDEGDRVYFGSWDGYPAARQRLISSILTKPKKTIVLSGDVHSSWLNRVMEGDKIAAVEVTGPSVTSGWPPPLADPMLASQHLNPHARLIDMTSHGYVRHNISKNAWRASYQFLDNVTVPGATISQTVDVVLDINV